MASTINEKDVNPRWDEYFVFSHSVQPQSHIKLGRYVSYDGVEVQKLIKQIFSSSLAHKRADGIPVSVGAVEAMQKHLPKILSQRGDWLVNGSSTSEGEPMVCIGTPDRSRYTEVTISPDGLLGTIICTPDGPITDSIDITSPEFEEQIVNMCAWMK